jgi:putative spermidine/putrescine transport system permease protein
MSAERIIKWITLLFFLAIFVVPLMFLFVQSFAFGWRWPDLFPPRFDLRGWEVLFRDPHLVPALWTTALVGGVVVLLNLVLAMPAGKALAHFTFPGKAFLESILLMPILIPSLAVAMGIHFTMIKMGLAGTWWGVVFVHLIPTLPYSVRIFRAGFERMGRQWAEQAKSLGATNWMIFRMISIPFLLPSIRGAIILSFVISLSQYLLTMLIGGGSVVTLAMIYYPYIYSGDYAVVASFSMIFALFPLCFLALSELALRLISPISRLRNTHWE